ncbi:MAG: CDP-alcohol phosphatidyltransferase family protein [Acidimicrobiales bacterium]
MFDGNLRKSVDQAVKPIGQSLQRAGVKPDHLTALGMIVSFVAAAVIANGWLNLGVLLLAVAALPDLLDGAVAKAAGTASTRGAFFDSTADRVTDGVLLFGVAWYIKNAESPELALLPMAILGVTSLISYQRAKAESLGFDAKGGLMERAERLLLLGFGLFFGALLVPVLWLLFVLSTITAIQRFVKIWKQASVDVPVVSTSKQRRPRRAARSARMERRRQRVRRTPRR